MNPNKKLSLSYELFLKDCELIGYKPNKRQFKKYLNKTGIVYNSTRINVPLIYSA